MAKEGQTIGSWTLIERVGRGGQGQVWQARGSEGREIVALKLINAARIKKRARFIQEIRSHKSLSDSQAPNIVPLLDSNLEELENEGVQGYLVMPLAHSSLQAQLPAIKQRIELALEIFSGILQGVIAAHEAGIVHRDLKPANILFLDASLRAPLITDFGICLLRETPEAERLTDVGETVGAKFFMAPEQERGGVSEVDETADIYALGKLLHHMLTDRYIYREDVQDSFVSEEVHSDPRYATIRDKILAPTIAEHPRDRIQSAQALFNAVQEVRVGKDVPDSTGEPSTGGKKKTAKHVRTEASETEHSLEHWYRQFAAHIEMNRRISIQQALDQMRHDFSLAWEGLYEEIQNKPKDAPEAAKSLVAERKDILGFTLAISRFDATDYFTPWKRFLEYILAAGEARAGYAAVFTVPHVLAGYLYMVAVVQALAHECWGSLKILLQEQFEWRYRGDKPLFDYGFNMTYFFHAEAMGREGPKIHDFYRAQLGSPEIASITTFEGEDLKNRYLQAQFVLCLRAAQEAIAGNDSRIWPDYGRFFGGRVVSLLERVQGDVHFGTGLAAAFGETREQFLAKANERIAFIPKHFWGSVGYFWDSIASWQPE